MNDRAQSTLDFLLGAVIMLIAVMIVATVIPGMLDPFATGSEAHPVIADRAVTSLATDELAAESPYQASDSTVQDVFAQSESGLRSTLALPASVRLNVTMDNRSGRINATGPVPPSTRSVTAAWRVVDYQGTPANVTVRVWA